MDVVFPSTTGNTYNEQVYCPSQYNFNVGYYVIIFNRNLLLAKQTGFYYNEFKFSVESLNLPYNLASVVAPNVPCSNIDADHSCLDSGIIKNVALTSGGGGKTFYFSYNNPSAYFTRKILNKKLN